MVYAKERAKLQKLSVKIDGLKIYDEKNLAVITDIYEQYSHTVRILKNKDPERFISLYEQELQQVKAHRKTLKITEAEEDIQPNFLRYRDALLSALTLTIQATVQ